MSDITNAIKQICDEKGLGYEAVIETIESALAAAYRKDFGEKNQNIKVTFDPETGKSKVYDVKTVVEDLPEEAAKDGVEGGESGPALVKASEDKAEKKVKKERSSKKRTKKDDSEKDEKVIASDEPAAEVPEEEKRRFNPKTEIQLKDAKLNKKTAKIGEEIKTKLEVPASYGRMAAQTAKQVIIQKLREAERDMIFNDFKDKEHEVIAGVIQRREGRTVLVDLDRTVGILPAEEQIHGERYRAGERIKVYVRQVNVTPKGPEIILSRTADEILKKVFYLEIPEIANGLVEIKAVAREAGSRAKVAVQATSENVDPIGSCVGQRGARIQTIISELGGEKIDIIEYDEDPARFVANALAPAKVLNVEIDNSGKKAVVKVLGDQLSLAIGRDGQNVRLAARLTGWKLDIVGDKKEKPKTEISKETITEKEAEKDDKEVKDEGVKLREEKNEEGKTKKTEEVKPELEIEDEEKGEDIPEMQKQEEKKEEEEKSEAGVIAEKSEAVSEIPKEEEENNKSEK